MPRAAGYLFGLLLGAALMGMLYLAYETTADERTKAQLAAAQEVSEEQAERALQVYWDGDGQNGWTTVARLDSFGLATDSLGHDTLVVKGTFQDTVKVLRLSRAQLDSIR